MTSRTPDTDKLPISCGQRVLRYVGAVILSACAVMFVLGLSALRDRLHGLQLARYWTWCFILAVASIICALWDLILVRRAFKQTRRQLFQEQFMTGDLAEKLRKKDTNGTK
jgi:NADH:ubiquinone oxidoreductase subunit 6 (subunit J)